MRGHTTNPAVVVAGKIATARAFNFDNSGALIRQVAGTKRSCYGMFQSNHRYTFKRLH
jgi:hypothetical protein